MQMQPLQLPSPGVLLCWSGLPGEKCEDLREGNHAGECQSTWSRAESGGGRAMRGPAGTHAMALDGLRQAHSVSVMA